MKGLSLLATVLLLAGCTAGGAEYSPMPVASGNSAVYVYTLDQDMLETPQIVIDGREVGKLRPLGHIAAEVEPGHHSITTTAIVLFKRKPVEIEIAAGQSVYLRLDAFRGSLLTEMPADIAREEIRTTRMSSG